MALRNSCHSFRVAEVCNTTSASDNKPRSVLPSLFRKPMLYTESFMYHKTAYDRQGTERETEKLSLLIKYFKFYVHCPHYTS